MQQAQQESKLSRPPKRPVPPLAPLEKQAKGSHHCSEPEQRRAGAATHRLWAGSWPCSVAPAGSSQSLGLFHFLLYFLLPASPSSAREPHPLFLHPSSEQLPTTRALLARYQGQACVLKTALEVTNKGGGRAAPESTFYSSIPAFAKEAFSVTTVAEEGKDTHKKLCYHQTTTCVEEKRFLLLNRWQQLI